MISTTSTAVALNHRSLVDGQLWDRLVARVMKEAAVEPDIAARIMDQALGFLRLVALEPEGMYAPSPMVDHGWHSFLQYTREYAAFSSSVAGHFIHHIPLDDPNIQYETNAISRTVAAMEVHGLTVDQEMLDGTVGDCGGHSCYTCVS